MLKNGPVSARPPTLNCPPAGDSKGAAAPLGGGGSEGGEIYPLPGQEIFWKFKGPTTPQIARFFRFFDFFLHFFCSKFDKIPVKRASL